MSTVDVINAALASLDALAVPGDSKVAELTAKRDSLLAELAAIDQQIADGGATGMPDHEQAKRVAEFLRRALPNRLGLAELTPPKD